MSRVASRLRQGAITWLASDTYTRADSASSIGSTEGGSLAYGVTSTWGIASNKGYHIASGVGSCAANVNIGQRDCIVEADITLSSGKCSSGIAVRGPSSGTYGTLVRFRRNTGMGWDYIEAYDGGSFLFQVSSAGYSLGSTYRLKAVCQGTSFSVYVDDVLKGTSSSLPNDSGRTWFGLFQWDAANDDDGGTRYDNLSIIRL